MRKMRMRKLGVILLVMAMGVNLLACGGKAQDNAVAVETGKKAEGEIWLLRITAKKYRL